MQPIISPSSKHLSISRRNGNAFQHIHHNIFLCLPSYGRLMCQRNAVRQDMRCQILDIIRRHILAAVHHRVHTRSGHKKNAAAGRRTEYSIRACPGCSYNLRNIGRKRGFHKHTAGLFRQVCDILPADNRLYIFLLFFVVPALIVCPFPWIIIFTIAAAAVLYGFIYSPVLLELLEYPAVLTVISSVSVIS